jgi:uncharacterized protein
MDVTLVLTHRCNLACSYCYAGEHIRREMGDETREAALDLLFSDDAPQAQLSFFGGEPFLAFDAMRRAVASAQQKAQRAGRKLLLQCTTNGSLVGPREVGFIQETGMRVTVSIDGGLEAHDAHRRKTGGGSSFEDVHKGLRALLAAGIEPEAMMVITPETALFVFRSVRFLFAEGVRVVRANLSLQSHWPEAAKNDLQEELVSVGRQVLWHRLRGEQVVFKPFEESAPTSRTEASVPQPRQVVVGAEGHLYPCSPMVGEDRDTGPEANMRIGHLADGPAAIHERVEKDGAGCGGGRSCACAAYLETGDRRALGPNARWFARVCADIGTAIDAALADVRHPELSLSPLLPIAVPTLEMTPLKRSRSFRRAGLILGTGGIALGGLASSILSVQGDMQPRAAAPTLPSPPPELPPPPPEPVKLPDRAEPEGHHAMPGRMVLRRPPDPPKAKPRPGLPRP